MVFLFHVPSTTEIYTYGHTLSLPSALPISCPPHWRHDVMSIPLGCISLPVYNANGVAYDSVSGVDRFTFDEGALPVDGSMAFAVIRINPSFSSIRKIGRASCRERVCQYV